MTSLEAIIKRLADVMPVVKGVTIFGGTDAVLPDHGNGFISVLETGGFAPSGTHNEGAGALRHPSFQISSRANDYRVTSSLILRAYEVMAERLPDGTIAPLANILIGDVFFLHLGPTSEPFSLPVDLKGRSRMAFNLDSTRRG